MEILEDDIEEFKVIVYIVKGLWFKAKRWLPKPSRGRVSGSKRKVKHLLTNRDSSSWRAIKPIPRQRTWRGPSPQSLGCDEQFPDGRPWSLSIWMILLIQTNVWALLTSPVQCLPGFCKSYISSFVSLVQCDLSICLHWWENSRFSEWLSFFSHFTIVVNSPST